MLSKNKKLLIAVFGLGLIAGLSLCITSPSPFLGQLKLFETGDKLFTTGGSKDLPVFKICVQRTGDCLTQKATEKTIRFKLSNGEYLNQISLENGKFGAYKLVVEDNKSETVKLAKRGTDNEVKLSSAETNISDADAIYVKEATGLKIKIPEQIVGKGFDVFNLGHPIKDSEDIKVLTFSDKTKDGTGEIFVAYPEFMDARIGGKQMASDILAKADEINEKIAKELGTNKTQFYLVVTPSVIAPDFYRSIYYTASGMAYPKILDASGKQANVKPKYGLNLEKTFEECAKDQSFTTRKCYEAPKSMAYLTYLLGHEFSHLYQYQLKTTDKLKGDRESYLESAAEINALNLTTTKQGIKPRLAQKLSKTGNCTSLGDDHQIGFCLLYFFVDKIPSENIPLLFKLSGTYDFGDIKSDKFCDTWFSIIQSVTNEDLSVRKEEFKKVCRG